MGVYQLILYSSEGKVLHNYQLDAGSEKMEIRVGRGERDQQKTVMFREDTQRIDILDPRNVVSSEHGIFRFENDKIYYVDNHSTNGSYDLHGKRVSELNGSSLEIVLGNEIRISVFKEGVIKKTQKLLAFEAPLKPLLPKIKNTQKV